MSYRTNFLGTQNYVTSGQDGLKVTSYFIKFQLGWCLIVSLHSDSNVVRMFYDMFYDICYTNNIYNI